MSSQVIQACLLGKEEREEIKAEGQGSRGQCMKLCVIFTSSRVIVSISLQGVRCYKGTMCKI